MFLDPAVVSVWARNPSQEIKGNGKSQQEAARSLHLRGRHGVHDISPGNVGCHDVSVRLRYHHLRTILPFRIGPCFLCLPGRGAPGG